MNSELVKTLVSEFASFEPEEVNILDWHFVNSGVLEFKMEDEDGCVRIYQIGINCVGCAKSLDQGNFDIAGID